MAVCASTGAAAAADRIAAAQRSVSLAIGFSRKSAALERFCQKDSPWTPDIPEWSIGFRPQCCRAALEDGEYFTFESSKCKFREYRYSNVGLVIGGSATALKKSKRRRCSANKNLQRSRRKPPKRLSH